MKRKLLCSLMAAALLLTGLTIPAQAVRRDVSVQVDTMLLHSGSYLENGVTYVPLRTLLDAFGGWSIRWDSSRQEAVAASASTSLSANPAKNILTVNGKKLSGRVTVENGRTYVPLRLIGEALSCRVVWDPYLDGAAVTSPNAKYDAMDLYWLSRIIYAESGAEPMNGQIAVGNVVLNRVSSDEFPNTIPSVIFDRKHAVQFEPVSNGTVFQNPSQMSITAAKRALDGESTVGNALYFYAPALSQGVWINANRPYSQTIGCHRFYL